jgi:diguanylate cyclase (GGDEF)-like protein/PAS domain S-box-containing protein
MLSKNGKSTPRVTSPVQAADFEGLLEAVPDALVGVDRAGVIQFANHQTEVLFGYDRDDLVGQVIEILVPDLFRAGHQGKRELYLAAPRTRALGQALELRGQRRDGTEFFADIALSHMDTGEGLLVIAAVRDMTDRREAEYGRRRSDRLAAIVENSDDAIIAFMLDGIVTSWNPAAERMYGYSSKEAIGTSILSRTPEDRTDEIHSLLASVRAGKYGEHHVTDRVRKDGTLIPVSFTISPMRDEDGAIIGASTIARDVTELQHAARYARSLIEAALDPLVTISPEGKITDVNEATVKVTGVAREELLGTDFSHYFTDPGKASEGYERVFAQGSVTDYPLTLRHRDGTLTEVLYNASVYRDFNGKVLGVFAAARDVTEQKRAFVAAQRMAAIIEYSDDAIIGKTLDGIITSWNPAAERMYGYCSEEIIGRSVELLSPEGREGEVRTILAQIRSGQRVDNFETIRVRKDGRVFPVSLTVSPICDGDGTTVGASAISRDVTEQQQAAENVRSLAAAEDLVRTVMASASIGIALADMDGSFRVVNGSLRDLLGFDDEWFLAHRIRDMVHPDDVEGALKERARFLAGSSDKSSTKLRLVRADGATVWVRRVAVQIHGGAGQPNMLMVQLEDITAEHEAQEALDYQTFHDPLTGLHNRAWILDILAVDLREAKRAGTCVGALFVDLDNFKVVNDSLGHGAGDEVLATVADRIVAGLRPGDRLGRFGGDEFVIVVHDVQKGLEVERCVERVSASIAADLQVQGHRIVPTASIGIATSTSISTPDSLLRDADSALSRAKAAGRASWHFFDDAMHAQAVARLTVEDQLRDAITRSEFVVYYQPIVALADAHVVGHEALVRWAHPTRGLLSPGDFLDVAEDTKLITTIGAQVLEQVCAMLVARPDVPGPISVNVSAVQLAAPGWLRSVTDTLTAHRIDPARIVIEVTETAVLSLVGSARVALESLRGLGVGIHLDDFGTGYSSISVLRDLPVTGVKLDLRFVQDLTTGDSPANALAQGVSGLVNGMHLTGIAEGIETQLQADILRAQGWECGQGYYFGRPAAMPVTDLFADDEATS